MVFCAAAVISMAAALYLSGIRGQQGGFVPPEFDPQAVSGTPVDAGESWTEIYQDGMGFSAHVCGRIVIEDDSADIYFTNDQDNQVWMKLRVTDAEGNILGETGLIKPGEYVKSVVFHTVPDKGRKISMKIMAYEPKTYYSAGAVTLNTEIGG